ncbi:hypothetical protein DFH09DRAFT_283145 [Mycena vulgaris]|nr:hypothetical protein DFH09DRAFT_283145 [Mycena vulgaris]
MTSRSFPSVMLEGDLAGVVCLFWFCLVLRALDPIEDEDDMTLPSSPPAQLPRPHPHAGLRLQDRQLLLEYPVVIEELLSLPEKYCLLLLHSATLGWNQSPTKTSTATPSPASSSPRPPHSHLLLLPPSSESAPSQRSWSSATA